MAGAFPILFLTSTRIGDAVLSSGLLKRLHDEIPNARFTIAAGAPAAPLFRDMPRLDDIIVVEKKKGGGHWLDLWGKVRQRHWGFVLDLRGSGLSHFLSSKKNKVYRRPRKGAPIVHKVVEAARLLKLEEEPPAPFLFTSPDTEAKAAALLGNDPRPILAIGPGANWVGKAWPAERFNETAARLLGSEGVMPGGRLLVLGGEQDREGARAARMAMPRERVIDLAGKADLLTAYACLKRARLFIGNDSGLMHLAAAAGTPTVGLFGPSDERRYGPWGPHVRAVRGPRDFDDFLAADPHLNQALNHMMDLPVDTVTAAVSDLYVETEPDFAHSAA
jgi:ADP-heptose:LPS heptosyltransferase